ncbi:MAG: hypothetical protein RDV41_05065, partial [Planctomycetota bacterium]|nr:hypothetical protein [Planctomycetota bacterium]
SGRPEVLAPKTASTQPRIERLDATATRAMLEGISPTATGTSIRPAPDTASSTLGDAPIIREVVKGPSALPADSLGVYSAGGTTGLTNPLTVRGANLGNPDTIRLCAKYENGEEIAYYANEIARVVDANRNVEEAVVSFRDIENVNDIRSAAIQAVNSKGVVTSEAKVQPTDASIRVAAPRNVSPGATVPVTVDYASFIKAAQSECFGFELDNYALQLSSDPPDIELPPTALLNQSGITVVSAQVPPVVVGLREWRITASLAAREDGSPDSTLNQETEKANPNR